MAKASLPPRKNPQKSKARTPRMADLEAQVVALKKQADKLERLIGQGVTLA